MQYMELKHTHEKAGRFLGTQMVEQGILIGPMIANQLNEEKRSFAADCLPIYEYICPELLEEIKGIAEGSGVSFFDLFAFISSMFCFAFEPRCTCIALKSEEHIYLARNSDFYKELAPLFIRANYQLSNTIPFKGTTTAFVEMEDGMNECGLAVGMTMVYPSVTAPGLNAGILLRCILERCHHVQEA